MKWIKSDYDRGLAQQLAQKYSLDRLHAAILVRRGVFSPAELLFYLESDLAFTHNPYLFVEMEDVVQRILTAIEEGEQIRIFGDRDVDGITSTVLIYQTLVDFGADVSWRLPSGDDPYGLTISAVDEFADGDGTLLITVDCGISNNLEVAHASKRGIDTLVIDHHNPGEELPPAFAIINPKIEDAGYPFEGLAGCGVVVKVIWALLFSRTRFYNRTVCLLNAHPGNESVTIDAVKLMNLVEVASISETIVPGMVDPTNTRIVDFLQGEEIMVFDAEQQTRMLKSVFGANTDVHLFDLSPEFAKVIPAVQGKSLLGLREMSRKSRYREKPQSEIDVLVSLFNAFVTKSEEDLANRYTQALDLVAVGTLADLMPLRNENRILVTKGMAVLNSTTREGLKELLVRQNLLGKTIGTTDVGWQISPIINAAGRLGVPERAAELLLSTDPIQRRELTEEVVKLNKQRKKLGDDVWKKMYPEAKKSLENMDGKLVIVGSSDIHRGVTGIIASRLANTFNVPAVVVAFMGDKAVGSIRSAGDYNVKGLLERVSEVFIDFGGHDYAAGFSLPEEEFPRFCTLLHGVRNEIVGVGETERAVEIDAELPRGYMTPDLISIVEQFEPYGEGNPPLVFLTKNVVVTNIELMGKAGQNHVRLLIDTGDHKWPSVYWNASERVNKDFSQGDRVDIVFRLGRNYYQNQEKLQLTMLDISRV